MRILLVEDSVRLSRSLQSGLGRLGHAVDVVHDGKQGLSYARLNPYDLLVLDVMLPGLDGLSLLRELRALGRDVRVLLLTARDAVADRVAGLRAGADDYLVKPFAFDELVARVDALGRRAREGGHPVTRVGALRIDTAARTVHCGEREVVLSRREYQLLSCLAQRPGEIVSRTEIEDRLYGEHDFPASNVVACAPGALEVSNAAGGLLPEDLPHLAEPFWRRDASRSDPAHSGLGLSLVETVLRALGGRLGLQLRDGRLVARVELPGAAA